MADGINMFWVVAEYFTVVPVAVVVIYHRQLYDYIIISSISVLRT
jgi:hypothetical protein